MAGTPHTAKAAQVRDLSGELPNNGVNQEKGKQ